MQLVNCKGEGKNGYRAVESEIAFRYLNLITKSKKLAYVAKWKSK